MVYSFFVMFQMLTTEVKVVIEWMWVGNMQVIQNIQMIPSYPEPPPPPTPLSPIPPPSPLVLYNNYVQNFFAPDQELLSAFPPEGIVIDTPEITPTEVINLESL